MNKRLRFRFIFIIELVLGLVLAFFIYLIFADTNPERKVAVIVSESGDERWTSFFNGLKHEADILGINLIICNTDEIDNATEEEELIAEQLDNGAAAMIIEPAPGEDTAAMLDKYARKIPMILVESDSELPGTDSSGRSARYIGPDNERLGEDLAQALMADYNGNISGKTIGIISSFSELESQIDRVEGFQTALQESGATVSWKISADELAENMDIKTYVFDQTDVDFIVVMDSGLLESVGEAAMNRRVHGALIYGVGTSSQAIYYLDHEVVQKLAVTDGYEMGTESLQELSGKMQSVFYTMKDLTVNYRILKQKDLFLEENQNYLFMDE